jgi:DeoR/GlpR family transcriptional regulator of sugar metabolism
MRSAGIRQRAIQEAMSRQGRAEVAELAARLGVSAMTVRRDLAALERAGVLTRTHGGAVPRSALLHEATFAEKDRRQQAQKAAIAAEAVRRFVRPGVSLYLDTGTTAMQVARTLPAGLDLRVFTNNLRAALELFGRPGVEVSVYGGRLGTRNPDLTGAWAVLAGGGFAVDVAFLGCDTLDPARGEAYAADEASAVLSRAVQARAQRIVLLADSAKWRAAGPVLVLRLATGMSVLTDTDTPEAAARMLARRGVQVVRVQPAPPAVPVVPTGAGRVRNRTTRR